MSVTINQVVNHPIVELVDLRRRCNAINKIQKFLKSKKNDNFFLKTKKSEEKSGFLSNLFRPRIDANEKKVSGNASVKAKESYETMLENEELGDVCVAETCFILVGTNSGEQALMLNALKELVQLHRMQCDMLSNSLKEFYDDCDDNRKGIIHFMLHRIKTKLYLSPGESRVKYPNDEYEFINKKYSRLEFDPLLENLSKISLPLPLPDMIGEWGVATLFIRFNPSALLLTLNMLLLEASVLVIGTRRREVSCCTSALLTLLDPYKWASVFMPLIPTEYLDFVESPVPFIAGIVPDNNVSLDHIVADERITNAIESGMILLHLDRGNIIADDHLSKEKKLAFSQTLPM